MTPRQFSRLFSRDSRLASGRYFSSGPVRVSRGDRVGVVLLNLGGPQGRRELETFLYRRWMDPVVEKTRLRPGRHSFVRIAAKLGSRSLWRDYEQIGGECPINRRSREQAAALQECLNGALASRLGVTFKTYLAMRYGTPSSEDAMRALVRDGVTKTILLPLYPQYSIATTGSSLAYWSVMSEAEKHSTLDTTAVLEYAAHPDYLQSLSERIDEALQRFPKRVRPATHIVFCAKSHPAGGALDAEESFCRLMHESIRRVVDLRGAGHQHHSTFFESRQSDLGFGHEDTRNTIRRLADDGAKSVLLVPIGITTDELWTCYTLDIVLRKEFEASSIRYFEVASSLNCHPLFIATLSRVVARHLTAVSDQDTGGDRASAPITSAGSSESAALRAVRACETCHGPISARQWTPSPTEFRPAAGA